MNSCGAKPGVFGCSGAKKTGFVLQCGTDGPFLVLLDKVGLCPFVHMRKRRPRGADMLGNTRTQPAVLQQQAAFVALVGSGRLTAAVLLSSTILQNRSPHAAEEVKVEGTGSLRRDQVILARSVPTVKGQTQKGGRCCF